MKKLLVVVCAVLFLTVGAGNVLALSGLPAPPEGGCWNCAEEYGVSLNLAGQDVNPDESNSSTGHSGNHNDKSFASATSYAGFNVDLYANGTEKRWTGEYVGEDCNDRGRCSGYFVKTNGTNKGEIRWFDNKKPRIDNPNWEYVGFEKEIEYRSNPADVFGLGIAVADSHAWSYAKDYGLTSKAGAGAKAGSGFIGVTGLAKGKDGCPESITGTMWIGGDVYQSNEAGETGYANGQFVNGGNESWAGGMISREVEVYESRGGKIILFDGWFTKDAVQTKGSTFVTIDPNHSFFGTTQNSASVDFGSGRNGLQEYLQSSYVGGSGGVAGMVNNGGSYAGGQATFSYIGNTQGNGNAIVQGSIMPGGVFVSGSAHASGDNVQPK